MHKLINVLACLFSSLEYKLEQIPGKFSQSQKPVVAQVDWIKKYYQSDPLVTLPPNFDGNLRCNDPDLETLHLTIKKI